MKIEILVILGTLLSVSAVHQSQVVQLQNVVDAVVHGEEKLKEHREKDKPTDPASPWQILGRKDKSIELQDQSILRLATSSKLVETTGMTEEELRNDDTVNAVLQELEICPKETIQCPSNKKYRTIDGSCNNEDNKSWGKAFTVQQRWLPPAYGPNNSPRRRNGDLPSARVVSNEVFKAGGDTKYDNVFTNLVMAWGQLIDHDITHTPTSGSFDCCDEEVANNQPECFPIKVPAGDERFTDCLTLTRSMPYTDSCTTTRRDQINELTAFVDGSMVYGSSEEELAVLKHQTQPYLLNFTDRGNLLPEGSSFCIPQVPTDFCQHAGDVRVNVIPQLATMQTLLMREHNRIARIIKDENRHGWNAETIFQETRKIVGALIQHITYSEWLPAVIGTDAMRRYDLEVTSNSFKETYDSKVNPQIRNAFAAAALRYGHSIITPTVAYMSKSRAVTGEFDLKDQMLNPHMTVQQNGDKIDDLTRWLYYGRSAVSDSKFEDDIRDNLFHVSDLPARNVQRGRDHGIPAYFQYRKLCGLPEDLSDMSSENVDKLSKIYASQNDIDLYAGAMSERKVNGGDVGPTFSCLLGKQFELFKKGDSFWYERPPPSRNSQPQQGFTIEQLEAIKDVSMSGLLCANFNLDKIQEDPFRQEQSNGCSSSPPTGGQRPRPNKRQQGAPCNRLLNCDDPQLRPLYLVPWTNP